MSFVTKYSNIACQKLQKFDKQAAEKFGQKNWATAKKVMCVALMAGLAFTPVGQATLAYSGLALGFGAIALTCTAIINPKALKNRHIAAVFGGFGVHHGAMAMRAAFLAATVNPIFLLPCALYAVGSCVSYKIVTELKNPKPAWG